MGSEIARREIMLPADLYSRLETAVKDSPDFGSVDEFVVFVLNEVLAESGQSARPFTADEEKQIKRTLKALGHFDP